MSKKRNQKALDILIDSIIELEKDVDFWHKHAESAQDRVEVLAGQVESLRDTAVVRWKRAETLQRTLQDLIAELRNECRGYPVYLADEAEARLREVSGDDTQRDTPTQTTRHAHTVTATLQPVGRAMPIGQRGLPCLRCPRSGQPPTRPSPRSGLEAVAGTGTMHLTAGSAHA